MPCMNWNSSNLPEAWKKFHEHCDLIFKGPLKDKDESVQVTYLLLWMGEKGRDIYGTLNLSAENRNKLKPICEAVKKHLQPTVNPVFARYRFNNETQNEQSFEEFLTKLRLLVIDCDYRDKEEMIRDRIVFGVKSPKIREKLINEGKKLSLEKAIQICQSFEYAQEQLREMSHQPQATTTLVNAIKSKKKGSTFKKGTGHNTSGQPGHNTSGQGERKGPLHPKSQPVSTRSCQNCGKYHGKTQVCTAKGKQCFKCKKWNHFSSVCKSSVNEIRINDCEISDTNDYQGIFVDCVESKIINGQVFADFEVGHCKKSVKFKLDTGSQVNILPYKVFQSLGTSTVLEKAETSLTAYNGSELDVMGCITIQCNHPGTGSRGDVLFYVVNTRSPPLLGFQSSIDFGLIKLSHAVQSESLETPLTKLSVLQQHSEVFRGLGLFPGECKIHIDPLVTPVVHPPRKIPVALHDKVKNELSRMEKLGVITKVTEPTEWVSSMVVAEKSNGDIRICLDPRDLNKAILRPHYPMRTIDDILPQLSGAKYFTKLDARSGYWALKLDHDSSLLTCFNTMFGRYRYLRVPFGLKLSGDLFVRKIDECYEGLKGVVTIVDDILVYGKTREDHDKNLQAVLQRSLDQGIRFNEDKLEVGVSEVEYFGHLLTSEGLKPDPAKVTAVENMQQPTNKAELETILGMVNYLSRFAPNLSEVTAPMRQLLPKDVEFCWESPQSDAFEKMKQIITKPGQVLAYFDPTKDLTLQCDASKYGLGSALLQEGKPIAYASKSLTPSEVNYAQIEKEMYAILFGCRKFHHFVYGRKVHVQCDHLPIISIFRKSINSAPARLQRMLLQLQKYDLDIKHYPSKQVPVADTLSRKFVSDTFPELSAGMDMQVHLVMSGLPVPDRKLQEIKSITQKV